MEFGFARFLEMFEERFGRTVTTAVLALVGLAVAGYSAKVIIEAVIYVYDLIKSADLIAALRQESAASHLIVFAVQIALTFVVLAFIWRYFLGRQLKAFEAEVDASRAKIMRRIEEIERRSDKFVTDIDEREERLNQRSNALQERMAGIKATQEKILAGRKQPDAKSPPEPPHPTPEQQDKPEKT